MRLVCLSWWKTVWISNGQQQVDAVLQIHTLPPRGEEGDERPRYRLTLNYRRVSFLNPALQNGGSGSL
ncbi:MAG: hypothetical protein U0003_03450 [Vampirovibrionales bacterium]